MMIFDSFINGLFFAFGTLIASTIGGLIIFRYTKNWITKTIAEIWATVKEEGLKLDGIRIDGHLETKQTTKKKKLK